MPLLSPSSLPFLGAGLGYRRAIAPFYAAHAKELGFLEVMPEHLAFAGPQARRRLQQDAAGKPVVTHSVTLSPGSADGPDPAWMPCMAAITERLAAPWASDHLCITKAGGRVIGQLTPFPYTRDALRATVANVKQVQEALGVPFLLENISQYFAFEGADYDEPAFFEQVTRRTGCGVLLDVTNLGNNAVNLGWDPKAYLDAFPLERVVQLHLAGAERIGGRLLDTHGAPIHRDVWRLTEEVIARCDVRALLVERDQTFGELERLAAEVRRGHALMRKARGASDAAPPESIRSGGSASTAQRALSRRPGRAAHLAAGGRSAGQPRPEPPLQPRRAAALLRAQQAVAALTMDAAALESWRGDPERFAAKHGLAGKEARLLASPRPADVAYYAARRRIDRWSFLDGDLPRATALARASGCLERHFDERPYPIEDPLRESLAFARWLRGQEGAADVPCHLPDLAALEAATARLWRSSPARPARQLRTGPPRDAPGQGASPAAALARRAPATRLVELRHRIAPAGHGEGPSDGSTPARHAAHRATFVALVRRPGEVAAFRMDRHDHLLAAGADGRRTVSALLKGVHAVTGVDMATLRESWDGLGREGLVR